MIQDGRPDDSNIMDVHSRCYQMVTGPIKVEEVLDQVVDSELRFCLSEQPREYTQGQRTVHLEYEAYGPIAIDTMRQIGRELEERWPDARCAITHRIGKVNLCVASVCIAVSAPHRDECFRASCFVIERLKQIVPIWKKEIFADGLFWKRAAARSVEPIEACQRLSCQIRRWTHDRTE